jgi:hypothetical protein
MYKEQKQQVSRKTLIFLMSIYTGNGLSPKYGVVPKGPGQKQYQKDLVPSLVAVYQDYSVL